MLNYILRSLHPSKVDTKTLICVNSSGKILISFNPLKLWNLMRKLAIIGNTNYMRTGGKKLMSLIYTGGFDF